MAGPPSAQARERGAEGRYAVSIASALLLTEATPTTVEDEAEAAAADVE